MILQVKLRRIHYLDINQILLDTNKVQMAELDDKKEDLTSTKIHLILDRVNENQNLIMLKDKQH